MQLPRIIARRCTESKPFCTLESRLRTTKTAPVCLTPPPPSPKIKQPILEEGEKSHPSLDSMFSESGEGPGVRRSNPNTKPRPPKAFNLQTSAGVRAKHPSSDVYLIDIQAGGWHSDQQGFTCGCFAPTLWLQLLPPLPSAHTSPSPPTSYSARRDTP